MCGAVTWGLWKVSSKQKIKEEDSASKYHWTGISCVSLPLLFPCHMTLEADTGIEMHGRTPAF